MPQRVHPVRPVPVDESGLPERAEPDDLVEQVAGVDTPVRPGGEESRRRGDAFRGLPRQGHLCGGE